MAGRGLLLIAFGMTMATGLMYAQSLMSSRAIGIGAYGAAVRDTRDFAQNPAGLVTLRDWDFTTSTYLSTTNPSGGFVFHGLAFGKRLLENEAMAFQYSPGTMTGFVFPPTLVVGPDGLPSSNDREIQYSEPFVIGIAHRFSREFTVGLNTRLRREEIADTQYEILVGDTVTLPLISTSEYRGGSWNLDLAGLWSPADEVTVSGVVRNLLSVSTGNLPEDLAQYRLENGLLGEIGVAAKVHPRLLIAAQLNTDGTGALGYEWAVWNGFSLRDGLYVNTTAPSAFTAGSISLGVSYEIVDVSIGYLLFFDQTNRQGVGSAESFDPSAITNLDLNAYSSNRLVLTAKVQFGNVRESLARIEGVEMFGGVYPSAAETFAYRPIGKATVKNLSAGPVQATVAFFVDRYMDEPSESRPVLIQPGESVDVPLTAVFNEQLQKVSRLLVREASVTVQAAPADQVDDRFQTRVLIHGRNAWNGDVFSLRYFVTANDPEVIRYSRDVLLEKRDSLNAAEPLLQNFTKAQTILDAFAGNLVYVGDPMESVDNVQYPAETLALRGGDCDDLTVCFVSLLGSIGIPTAFVDVVPPGAPHRAHIYMLFDTGVDPKYGSRIALNPKRYVIRKDKNGAETIWIPVETTVAAQGFDEAWARGAQEYFDDVEVGLGLIKGWVRVVDIH